HRWRLLLQAEDGIRDRDVTGVQTCALPILHGQQVEEPQVQKMVESYIEATTSFRGVDLMKELANVDVEEMERQKLEDMTPSPFTDKEQKWLLQAIEYYIKQSEIKERHRAQQ